MSRGAFLEVLGDKIVMIGQWRPLRVLVVGQQDNFGRVLATNIQCWGHQAILLSSVMRLCEDEVEAVDSDVLLYDLDESWQALKVGSSGPTLQHGLLGSEFLRSYGERGSRARLTIVFSSRSVSRMMLEEIGAVALLQKPFEIGRLQRYLSVLQRLILADTQEPRLSEQEVSKGNIRVLVVDDDVDVAHAIERCLLYESGYEVAVAYDGLEALEQCLDWRPQCIVTDLIMPWMNGYQVMRCLSVGSLRTMPAFVVMSALTQLEVPVNRSYLHGKTVVYVDKPFHIDHLLAAIKQVCTRE